MMDSGSVTFLRFDYRATAPFAVASPDPGGAVDLPISVDANGAPWIPPSAISGSLRAHLRRVMDMSSVAALMGSEPQDTSENGLTMSRLRVNGTVLSGVTKQPCTQTSIDRKTGSARAGSLRSVEAVGVGAQLVIYMTVDGDISDAEEDALVGWRPTLGRSRSVGMGSFEPTRLLKGSLDLGDPGQLGQWLAGGGPELHDAVATQVLDPAHGTTGEPLLCVHVRVVDGLFAFDSSDGNVAYSRTTMPGSSLKGVFRSRFEFILRSVGVQVCEDGQCGTCLACATFGYANAVGAQRSQIAFRDAPISLNGERIEANQLESRMHVAIDRVTGGASRNQLFEERLVPRDATFDIVIDSLVDDPAPWIRDLLLWVVKDLDDGYIGLGGKTTRGFGTVRIVEVGGERGCLGAESLEMLRPVIEIVEEGTDADA